MEEEPRGTIVFPGPFYIMLILDNIQKLRKNKVSIERSHKKRLDRSEHINKLRFPWIQEALICVCRETFLKYLFHKKHDFEVLNMKKKKENTETELTAFGAFLHEWGVKILIVILVILLGWYVTNRTDMLSPKSSSRVVEKLVLPGISGSEKVATSPSIKSGNRVVVDVLPSGGNFGFLLANGGTTTTGSSLMKKHGADVLINPSKSSEDIAFDLLRCAESFSQGNLFPDAPCMGLVPAGDAMADFIAPLNIQLSQYGAKVYIVSIVGFSQGEHKCVFPKAVLENKEKAKGMTIIGRFRRSSQQLCISWASQNDIAVNMDMSTYDEAAVNFMNMGEGEDMARYNTHCEERYVIRNGVVSRDKKTVCPDGVATDPFEDKLLPLSDGGLAVVESTASQSHMFRIPVVMLGVDTFMAAHDAIVTSMIRASLEASDDLKDSPKQSVSLGAKIASDLYPNHSEGDWIAQYNGSKTGDGAVVLGGAFAANISDNIHLFGLNGGANTFGVIYAHFRKFNLTSYPDLYPEGIPESKDILDLGRLIALKKSGIKSLPATMPNFTPGPVTHVESDRTFEIRFDTGSSVLKKDRVTLDALQELYEETVDGGEKIEIDGHTDNVGEVDANRKLSLARASAVKSWLQEKSPESYPDNRFDIEGMGSDHPVGDNATEIGRVMNRRTEIKQGY